ncbi:aspartate--tRNA(Asn) ligase [Candidatus Hecatella orcuttiae]|uniref:aspartate--tRNA(Asn) ligase n=1 Tax=Candidatus Hecatella orcuttiae TaxID=1935119 RepID=UPI002867D403|nr:aspartate--tRNA(Asn) ligase [Candidatus Hecatella orcuttiae]
MSVDKLGDWRRTHYSSEITPELDGQKVVVFGWVQSLRNLGGIKFILLTDREGTVQVTVPLKEVKPEISEKIERLGKQYVVGVKGTVRASEKAQQGVEIIPEELKILNSARHPLALDPTGRVPADLDVRLNARILDLRRAENLAVFKINHHVIKAIREFLDGKGFIEVQTPKIIATATEGGASLFPVVYFDREAFLAQSPQLYKEQLTSVMEKVYEIAAYFRAEESRTVRHTAEFISVDIEQAFANGDDVMKTLEELTVYVVKHVMDKCGEELKLLNRQLQIPSVPFPRYTYDEVLELLKERDFHVSWGEDLPTPALRMLGDLNPHTYYFITDWPTEAKAFYIKPRDDKPEICEGFDFMYSWIELASGGTRIHDKNLLVERLRQQGLNPESFEHHLKVFDYGMPPHAGWGLGLGRLLMVLTGKENVRECILFPRDRDRLTP